jgi:hypothetical protein
MARSGKSAARINDLLARVESDNARDRFIRDAVLQHAISLAKSRRFSIEIHPMPVVHCKKVTRLAKSVIMAHSFKVRYQSMFMLMALISDW